LSSASRKVSECPLTKACLLGLANWSSCDSGGRPSPARVAQIRFEARGVLGPGREDDAGIGLDAGLDQTEGRSVERVVIGLGFAGDVFERAIVAVGPAVIGAHEALGVAIVDAAHAVAAVAAHVQERVEPALSVAGQDDRVLAHVGVKEIVDRRHQALVPDHQPGAPEDLLHLVVVDCLLAEDRAVDFAGGGVDDRVFRSGAHTLILPCGSAQRRGDVAAVDGGDVGGGLERQGVV
jgi:hypothetical protein